MHSPPDCLDPNDCLDRCCSCPSPTKRSCIPATGKATAWRRVFLGSLCTSQQPSVLGVLGTNDSRERTLESIADSNRSNTYFLLLRLKICMNMQLRTVSVVRAFREIVRVLWRGAAHGIRDRQKNNATEMIGFRRVPSTVHSTAHARRRRGRRLSFRSSDDDLEQRCFGGGSAREARFANGE